MPKNYIVNIHDETQIQRYPHEPELFTISPMNLLKAVKISATFPFEVADLVKRRARDLGYKSVSSYLLGLVLFDLWARKPHLLTKQICNDDNQEMRDAVIREIVESYEGDPKPGGYFEHRLLELAREISERRESGV